MIFTPFLLAVIFDLSTAKKTECPPIISRAEPKGIYRFVKKIKFTPCIGEIPKCIYHAHHRFFCFSGKLTRLVATEVYPVYNNHQKNSNDLVQQDVFTGPFGNTAGTPFDLGAIQPIKSWKLCPGNFLYRVVAQGIIITKFDGALAEAGDCTPPDGFDPVEFDLGLGDYITDAWGRAAVVLDKLVLIVTPHEGDPIEHSVGGPYGNAFYATPDPSQFGPCDLVNLKGTVTNQSGVEPVGGNFISSLEFCWVCQGVPDDFIL